MAPGVDVEGSGDGATVVNATVCSAGVPASGTVTGVNGTQLRNVNITAIGVSNEQCAAVYLDSAAGTPLRDVWVRVGISGNSPAYGVVIATSTPISHVVTLENVFVEGFSVGAPTVGVLVSGSPTSRTSFRDVRFNLSTDVSPATAFRIVNARVAIGRAIVSIAPGPIPRPPATALLVEGPGSDVTVERSSLRAPFGTSVERTALAGAVRIANSLLEGSLSGTPICFSNYDANFAPVVC